MPASIIFPLSLQSLIYQLDILVDLGLCRPPNLVLVLLLFLLLEGEVEPQENVERLEKDFVLTRILDDMLAAQRLTTRRQ